MQAFEFGTIERAAVAEAALQQLFADYVAFEKAAKDPWSRDVAPPPLVAFGQRHGVEWPRDTASRFLLKGLFADSAELLRVDRIVFAWGGGFDLGGAWLQAVLRAMGASVCASAPQLVVRCGDPDARLAELTEFLAEEEDYADQFSVAREEGALDDALFSITLARDAERRYLMFDDSGVQDWAFVAVLPQLDGEDPSLRRGS